MSEGVWLLTTVGRTSWREVIEACRETGMTQHGIVAFDGTLGEPVDGWDDYRIAERRGIGYWMRRIYAEYPDADFYGWLADDTYPRTPGWDVALSKAAGDWNVAYADDGGYIPKWELEAGINMSSGLCWGGKLVREVGWWALPGLDAAWIDVAWTRIMAPVHLHAYCPGVLVEHRHPVVGGRAWDAYDQAAADNIETARPVFEAWARDQLPAIFRRLAAVPATGVRAVSRHPRTGEIHYEAIHQ